MKELALLFCTKKKELSIESSFYGCIIFGVDEEILHSHLFLYKKIETYEFFR